MCDRPTLKDLKKHVIPCVTVKWRDLGIELVDPTVLDIIEMDYPRSAEDRCTCMLRKWLDVQPNASWNQLLEAIKAVGLYWKADDIAKKLKGKWYHRLHIPYPGLETKAINTNQQFHSLKFGVTESRFTMPCYT